MIKKLFNQIDKIRRLVVHEPEKIYSTHSYSQCGEDRILLHLFLLLGIRTPSYIDIGANHPFELNNTALFYLKGSRGINIEPNSFLINKFKQYRPLDVNLNFGIGKDEGIEEFYNFSDDKLSTFSKDEASLLKHNGHQLINTESIEVKTLTDVLQQYAGGKFPDLLSIDVEGHELAILSSYDFKVSAPKVICAEISEYSNNGKGMKRDELINFIQDQGYFLYADTYLNGIFLRKDLW